MKHLYLSPPKVPHYVNDSSRGTVSIAVINIGKSWCVHGVFLARGHWNLEKQATPVVPTDSDVAKFDVCGDCKINRGLIRCVEIAKKIRCVEIAKFPQSRVAIEPACMLQFLWVQKSEVEPACLLVAPHPECFFALADPPLTAPKRGEFCRLAQATSKFGVRNPTLPAHL
jgi:hypothetical protein